jgi:AraC-like DNA-binding protein
MTAAQPETWDVLIRGVSLGASLLIAAVFWWPLPQRLLRLAGTALAGATIAFNLLRLVPAGPPHAFAIVAAMTAPFWFWAVIQILFEDRPRLPAGAWIVLAVVMVAAITTQLVPMTIRPVPAIVTRLIGIGLVAHAAYLVVNGRQDDLVAGRLRLRTALFVTLCVAVAGFVTLAVLIPTLTGAKLTTTPAIVLIAAFQLFGCALLFTPNFDLFRRPAATAAPLPPEILRLNALMDEERPWQDCDLTVAALAAKLGVPEYRLRKLINETLGHRNFAAFLNSYRLTAAAAALKAEPKLPILTIALDNGFGSIGPFNRAFRENFGMTPSQWRRQP